MKLFSNLLVIIITLPFCISEPYDCKSEDTSEGPSINCIEPKLGDTEGRICYGCLSKIPTFDLRDLAIVGSKKFAPCNFHTKVACPSADKKFKCFIKVDTNSKGKVTVQKGCEASDKSGCIPETKGDKPDKKQTCYCDKRLCNSDLILIGGSPGLSEKILNGTGSSVKGQWILIIMTGVILGLSQFSDELTCCVKDFDLKIVNTTDDDQVEGDPCTNRGTSCKDVRCGTNTCNEDSIVPDTECTERVQCPGARPTCRLLYYEVAEDKSPDDEELDLESTYYVRQDCFDNSNGDVEMGCTFYKKTFYLTNKRREIYQKECFCNNADTCNENLFEICVATDDEIKIVNDTCYHLANVGVRKAISIKTVIMYYIAYLMTYL